MKATLSDRKDKQNIFKRKKNVSHIQLQYQFNYFKNHRAIFQKDDPLS